MVRSSLILVLLLVIGLFLNAIHIEFTSLVVDQGVSGASASSFKDRFPTTRIQFNVIPMIVQRFPTCEPVELPPFDANKGFSLRANVESGRTESVGLRDLADFQGIYIGAATDDWQLSDPEFAGLLSDQFNMLATENVLKWEIIHPEPDRFDFSRGDSVVAFAKEHNMAVSAHVLVWDMQQPDWLFKSQHTRDEWIQILCKHIKTVVSHYRGQVYAWHVVNEAFQNNGELRDTHWLRAIGPEYIPMAFQWAHEADPDAKLFYNEHSAEGINVKSQVVYRYLDNLLAIGTPLDGIGLQMHVWLDGEPSSSELKRNIKQLSDLGLEVHITEMDVRIQYSSESETVKLAKQAKVYRQAISACLTVTACKAFITWGLTDRYSWIPHYTKHTDKPLLFDEAGLPKPAYFTVLDALRIKLSQEP